MNDTLTKTAVFAATPTELWSFLTDKDKLGRWFHPSDTDLNEPGAEFSCYRIADDGAHIPQIWGKVLRADAPSHLSYTFCIAPFDGSETTVHWSLEAVADGTRVTLRHEGISTAAGAKALPLMMALDKGWDEHLAGFRAVFVDA